MASKPYDIVILPSKELVRQAIELSADLQRFGTHFQLTDIGPFPHISLYMVQLKESDLTKVQEALASIAANTPSIALQATRYYQAEGYIDAQYARTEAVAHLQMAVVEAINPIRNGLLEEDKRHFLAATGKVRENFERYGYPAVGELFRPHVTFTRFLSGKAIAAESLPESDRFSGVFTRLGLFELGSGGTCVQEVAKFTLGTGV